jgi:hypothetical protein
MKPRTSLVLILALPLLTSANEQKASPRPQQSIPDQDEVVRISTNLVQLDSVVTDKSGKPVMGLGPEDFGILEDGRPQAITNFSYVFVQPLSGPAVSSTIHPTIFSVSILAIC